MIATIVVVAIGRNGQEKKLHTLGQSERGARIGLRWEILTQPSAQQRRKEGYDLRPGGYSNAPDLESTARARNDRRDAARQWADYPGAPLVLHLGGGIRPVRHTRLVPILDALAEAADRGSEMPEGIRVTGDTLYIDAAMLDRLIAR